MMLFVLYPPYSVALQLFPAVAPFLSDLVSTVKLKVKSSCTLTKQSKSSSLLFGFILFDMHLFFVCLLLRFELPPSQVT